MLKVLVTESLVVSLANVVNTGRWAGLGEMIKSLTLLINVCSSFHMWMVDNLFHISKWDVNSLSVRTKHFCFVFIIYILEFTMDICYYSYTYYHFLQYFHVNLEWRKELWVEMNPNFLLSLVFSLIVNYCTVVKLDYLSLNVISATYRMLDKLFNFSVPQFLCV